MTPTFRRVTVACTGAVALADLRHRETVDPLVLLMPAEPDQPQFTEDVAAVTAVDAAAVSIAVLPGRPVDAAAARRLLAADLVFAHPECMIRLNEPDEVDQLLAELKKKGRPVRGPDSWPADQLTAPELDARGLPALVDPEAAVIAARLAEQLCTRSPLALRLTKEITSRPGSLRQHLRWESEAQARCLVSPEHLRSVERGIL